MPSQEKKDKVKQIANWFGEADSLLVLRYRGLRVAEANEIRASLKGMDSELRVIKNTLTRIALAETPKEDLTPLIDGPVAVVFVRKEPGTVAKAIKDFSKGRKEFFLLGGWLEGGVMDGKQVEAFAALPPREVLLAQLVGAIQAPLARLSGNVAGPLRRMVGLLKAFGDRKAADTPAVTAEESPAAEETAKVDDAPKPEETHGAEDTAKPEETGEQAGPSGEQEETGQAGGEKTTPDAPDKD